MGVPAGFEWLLLLNIAGWFATALLAVRKGRFWLGWTAAAVVFSSLVIVPLALLPNRRTAQPPASPSEPDRFSHSW